MTDTFGPGAVKGPPRGVLRQTSLSKLGFQARSVAVPAAMVVGFTIAGLAVVIIAVIGLVARADVGEATGSTEVAADVCRARTLVLRSALLQYRGENDREAGRFSDIEPYLDGPASTHTVDFSQVPPQVVVIEDGACDYPDASAGAQVSGDKSDRAQAAIDFIAVGLSIAVVGGYLVMTAGAFLQGWWLACAYRCLPPSQQLRAPRRAYSPFTAVMVGTFLFAVYFVLGVAYLDPFAFLAGLVAGGIIWFVSYLGTVLVWIKMLGDVNFAFGRYTLPARLMRMSILWFLVLSFLGPLVGLMADAVTRGGWVLGWLALGLAVITAVLPLIGLISYVVAVLLATSGIESTLRDAASDLEYLDRRGWLAINHRKQSVRRG